MTPEGNFKTKLQNELRDMFPGCVIMKNDAQCIQGIPDMLILYKTHWAMLETKAYTKAKKEPNQPYWVHKLDAMSFAAFISPENKKEVLRDLQRAFQPGG